MRWSEEDLAQRLASGQVRLVGGGLTPAQQRYVSEQMFQSAVLRVAREHQWLAYHTFDSRRSPSGFPDLVLARAGSPLYTVELKREDGQVTAAQQAWLTALAGCSGVVSDIWRPAMLSEVVEKLRGMAGNGGAR